ncbi:hypothetical protein [Bacillus thuringiensis]|uniref:Uncharacterized protein n=1 Tax=Bacillus thuringiensis TaxID=1428 RepID=A0A9X7BT33_BACTU|nr:hypothetical protein [Bacillus thuringiensis]PFV35805.1 hypothetical protein COK99_01930 [Bacillus thuringiensis]
MKNINLIQMNKGLLTYEVATLSELKVSQLKGIARVIKLQGRSKYTTKVELVSVLSKKGIAGVRKDTNAIAFYRLPSYGSASNVVTKRRVRAVEKEYVIDTMSSALSAFKKEGFHEQLVTLILNLVSAGYSLRDIVTTPYYPEFHVPAIFVPVVLKFAQKYNVKASLKRPTRYTVASYSVVLDEASTKIVDVNVDGKMVKRVLVNPTIQPQSQSAVTDKFIVRMNEEFNAGALWVKTVVENGLKQFKVVKPNTEGAKVVRNLLNVMFVDFDMKVKENETSLTEEQVTIQKIAMEEGIVFKHEGKYVQSEVFYRSPSQERTLQATFAVEMDAVEALQRLGHEFTAYGSMTKDGNFKVDSSKAIKRFGLSGSTSIKSETIKIGSEVEEVAFNVNGKMVKNGDYILKGGTHTMLVTEDIYTTVQTGKYYAARIDKDETGHEMITGFDTFDAMEHALKLCAGDGAVFYDATVWKSLTAEFGVDCSAVQVRITPFGKGLAVFVPGLKDMFDVDVLAFKSAIKGDYRQSVEARKDIEFRVCLFNKSASKGKKFTLMPYQFTNSLPISAAPFVESAKQHMSKAIELYNNPKAMYEYLGLGSLEQYNDMTSSVEELDEADQKFIKNTLSSRFANFLYAGQFTMKDPVMKSYAKDIIENMIRQWAYGSIPVLGAYRFMTHDPYAILKTKKAVDRAFANGNFNKYRDEDGDVIIPKQFGIPANKVVCVDGEDKYLMDGQDVVMDRNPKIDDGETAFATTYVDKAYVMARKKYPTAFNNLIIYSVHDFLAFKQGGADFDGDKSMLILEKFIVDAVAKRKDDPATLDISYRKHEDGSIEFIEGCPFKGDAVVAPSLADFGLVEGKDYVSQKGYSVEFTKEQWNNKKLSRGLHDLSKRYMTRTLEQNRIGIMTNYATKLLDAVRSCTYMIQERVDFITGRALSDEDIANMKSHISYMKHLVRLIRLLQGWEIDRPKHGGAYEAHVDLSWESNVPYFASVRDPETGEQVVNKLGNTMWLTPEWMSARSGKKGVNTGSVISRIRDAVVSEFEEKIVKEFKSIDVLEGGNNLLGDFAKHIQLPEQGSTLHYAVTSNVRAIKKEYGSSLSEAFSRYEAQMNQLELMNTTPVERVKLTNDYDAQLKEALASAADISNEKMTALESELNLSPEVIGYFAYFVTYTQSEKIKTNQKHGYDPTRGLTFPWTGATNQLLAAVFAVENKNTPLVVAREVSRKPITSRAKLVDSNANTLSIVQNAKVLSVWVKEDEFTGNVLHHLYVGKQLIGHLYADKVYPYTGCDKFIVKCDDLKVNNGSLEYSATEITPYVQ